MTRAFFALTETSAFGAIAYGLIAHAVSMMFPCVTPFSLHAWALHVIWFYPALHNLRQTLKRQSKIRYINNFNGLIMKTSQDVADYLATLIKRSGKTQAMIAKECGFATANMMTMLKKNQTKIPLCRVPALSRALGVDPRELLGHCIEAYDPGLYKVLAEISPAMLITHREFKIIQALRAASKTGAFAV